MPVEKTQLRAVHTRETYRCDECGEGDLEWTRSSLMSNPAQYPHVCSNAACGYQANIRSAHYPRTVTEYKSVPSDL